MYHIGRGKEAHLEGNSISHFDVCDIFAHYPYQVSNACKFSFGHLPIATIPELSWPRMNGFLYGDPRTYTIISMTTPPTIMNGHVPDLYEICAYPNHYVLADIPIRQLTTNPFVSDRPLLYDSISLKTVIRV